ncbi:lytic transglycosylase domain-containing protein [Rhodovulum bhavnagarense]|nr:lytic transglycosylase domain-containing protein [Rhodovulum bhavnagarense]
MRRLAAAIGFGAALALTPCAGAEPSATSDFTFRRVKPPAPGAGRLITVQIAPAAPQLPPAADEPGTRPVQPDESAAWFWGAVSPALADSGPGRLSQAVAALATAPVNEAVSAPRLHLLERIAQTHGVDILMATAGTRVSPALALAVIGVESAGRADAVSNAGAQGLMQLMPATADRFGVDQALEAGANIRGGVAFLDHLIARYAGDPILVLAAYNAGEGAVRDHAGVPPFAETRSYVPRVLAAWTVARNLCQVPPVLISDGCIFQRMEKG